MRNNQFGIYRSYGYNNVTSVSIWLATQTSTAPTNILALQANGNLRVYSLTTSSGVWASGTHQVGIGGPFCLKMLDSGNLIWTNGSTVLLWHSSSVQPG